MKRIIRNICATAVFSLAATHGPSLLAQYPSCDYALYECSYVQEGQFVQTGGYCHVPPGYWIIEYNCTDEYDQTLYSGQCNTGYGCMP